MLPDSTIKARAPLIAALLALLAATSGCASLPAGSRPDPRDRFERFNRASYRFNIALDHAVLRPIARGYVYVTPAPLRRGLGNFFSNLGYPVTIVNQLLQGKLRLAGRDTARLVVNTIAGAGFFDPASRIGLERHDEDFGQTLGRMGVGTGPYLMLPLLGPSSVRDGISMIPDEYLEPRHYVRDPAVHYGLIALDVVDQRASLLPTDATLEQAFDPYAFVRNAWLQHREFQVRDGKMPEDTFEELPIDDESAPAPASEATPPAETPRR